MSDYFYVIVEVVEGRNLIPLGKKKNGRSPFVVVSGGKAKPKKTKPIRNTLNPKWRIGSHCEVFEIKVRPKKDLEILFKVYDKDKWATDDRMGIIKIGLSDLVPESGEIDKWYSLQPIKSGDPVSGELRIIVRPISKAARKKGDVEKEKQVKPNLFSNSASNTPRAANLIEAVDRSNVEEVERFLADPKTDVNQRSSNGETCLHAAVIGRQWSQEETSILNMILKHDAIDVTIPNKRGNTALHYFCKNYKLPDPTIVELFIEKGANLNAQNDHGETTLHMATFNTSLKIWMLRVLLRFKADPNIADSHRGETALHYAIRLGREDLVSCLLQYGADPEKKKVHQGKLFMT